MERRTYDMVAFQQMMKYGRTSATEFGDVDLVKYAESFGALGLRVNTPDELEEVLKEALAADILSLLIFQLTIVTILN